MTRLDEKRIQALEAWVGAARGEFVSISDVALQFTELHELLAGYQRAEAAEQKVRDALDEMAIHIDRAHELEVERDALRVLITDAIDHFSTGAPYCVDCHRREGHAEGCYIPKMVAAIAQPTDAGGVK